MNLSASVHIALAPGPVFEYVSHVTNDKNWRTDVVEAGFTTGGPMRVGSRGFDRVEANGREMVATWTAIELDPGSIVRWTLDDGPISGTGGYICQPDGEGTQFTLESYVKPRGVYRLLGPIFGWIGRRRNQTDVGRLKSILEAQ